jgi:uncharacterized membrane protein YvlD (DUF360 family)
MLTILTIVFTALILIVVAALTSNLEIDGLGSALTPGVAIAVVGTRCRPRPVELDGGQASRL